MITEKLIDFITDILTLGMVPITARITGYLPAWDFSTALVVKQRKQFQEMTIATV